MPEGKRSFVFWVFTVLLAASIVLMLMGQTVAVFNYDLAVELGMQESMEAVGQMGVQVNRSIGAGDTVVYVPLLIVSLVGLFRRKRWVLVTTGAVCGISAYWSITATFIFLFSPESPGYRYVPPVEVWIFVGAYLLLGIAGLFYLMFRGEELLQ